MRQYPLPLPHREAMEADDFMAAPSNREAVAWLEQWPRWPAPCLVLYGPPGSGKTHLTRMWLARSGGAALSLAELKAGEPAALLGSNPWLSLDDADAVAGDAQGEEALFHLYNLSREVKGGLLLTGRSAPAQWGIGLPDLRSRLLAAPVAVLAAPDDELLSALLVKQFRDRQMDIGLDVLDFIIARLERTPDAVRKIVADLDRASLAEGRRITVPLARRVMAVEGESK